MLNEEDLLNGGNGTGLPRRQILRESTSYSIIVIWLDFEMAKDMHSHLQCTIFSFYTLR
jgi:hypothetical protein